jgi:hypothetical protein
LVLRLRGKTEATQAVNGDGAVAQHDLEYNIAAARCAEIFMKNPDKMSDYIFAKPNKIVVITG